MNISFHQCTSICTQPRSVWKYALFHLHGTMQQSISQQMVGLEQLWMSEGMLQCWEALTKGEGVLSFLFCTTENHLTTVSFIFQRAFFNACFSLLWMTWFTRASISANPSCCSCNMLLWTYCTYSTIFLKNSVPNSSSLASEMNGLPFCRSPTSKQKDFLNLWLSSTCTYPAHSLRIGYERSESHQQQIDVNQPHNLLQIKI